MMTRLEFDRPLAILDLETTGVDAKNDRIIEISILKPRPGAEPDHRTRRVNPERPIPPEASAVHGITDVDVAGKPRSARWLPVCGASSTAATFAATTCCALTCACCSMS